MRPKDLKTRIFLDGGDPDESKEIFDALGFLDGQTTNPSLIAKNPEARERIDKGNLFSRDELFSFYKDVVQEISPITKEGSVSIEVYAEEETPAEPLLEQAREMYGWVDNAHIKFPTTKGGVAAAHQAVEEGIRVNMTLVFTEAQAASVYVATKGAKKGDVFVSPFIGRLDDQGENGMDLIKNITALYEGGDEHVEVLTASVRSLEHFLGALSLKSHIITAPASVLLAWAESGFPIPDSYNYKREDLSPIPPAGLDLNAHWDSFDLTHPLTKKGIEKFTADWNALLT